MRAYARTVSMLVLGSSLLIAGPIADLPTLSSGFGLGSQDSDSNYTISYWNTTDFSTVLSSDPTTSNQFAYAVDDSGGKFPFDAGHYMQNDASSRWISPQASYASSVTSVLSTFGSDPIGIYKYSLSLDMTGYLVSTAVVTGRWTIDNSGLGVYVNGIATGNVALWNGSGPAQFWQWNNLVFDPSLFVAGMNTIDFYVLNQSDLIHNPGGWGNPVALRTELSASAQADPTPPEPGPVPEPGTGLLLSIGIAGFLGLRHFSRKPGFRRV